MTAEPVSDEILYAVHAEEYVASVRALAAAGGGRLDPDTVVSAASYDAARAAAGAASDAVARVFGHDVPAAFAAVRPPGHHALRSHGMGFCLFNNVACAAVAARLRHGAERILILDWDLHHGNGTQDIFYRDGSVLFVSVHQEHWYPGTGSWDEVGSGAGEGFTVNIPLPAGTGDEGYRRVFEEVIVPLGRAFRSDLMLVSAGYDAHAGDPLGGMLVSTAGFGTLTRLAREAAGGSTRMVAVLEGGYHLSHLSDSVLATLSVLGGGAGPTGLPQGPEEVGHRAIADRIRQVRGVVRNYWNI